MRFFAFNELFIKPFRVKNQDGTDKNLADITVKWYFIERDGTIPTGSPITGVVTVAANGQVQFTVPAGLFTEKTRFTSQLNLTDGSGYDEDTEPFIVDIDNPRQRTT